LRLAWHVVLAAAFARVADKKTAQFAAVFDAMLKAKVLAVLAVPWRL